MTRPDRLTKCLLAAIVALLAIIAARPGGLIGAQANAASGSTDNLAVTPGYFTIPVSRISRDGIVNIHIMESSKAMIVQYKTGIEVYRIDNTRPPTAPAAMPKP